MQRLTALQTIVDRPFAVISYTEAVDRLLKAKKKFEYPVKWGADLQSEHERYLTEQEFSGTPLFVTDYPKGIKASLLFPPRQYPNSHSVRYKLMPRQAPMWSKQQIQEGSRARMLKVASNMAGLFAAMHSEELCLFESQKEELLVQAFYMRLNDDNKTVAAMDLLVPGVGELIGGSQREERYEVSFLTNEQSCMSHLSDALFSIQNLGTSLKLSISA